MGMTFCPETNEEAMKLIESGYYRDVMIRYLLKDNGQISWGSVEEYVNKNSVFELFEIDAEEYVDFEEMKKYKPSKLAVRFKGAIQEAYDAFKKDPFCIKEVTIEEGERIFQNGSPVGLFYYIDKENYYAVNTVHDDWRKSKYPKPDWTPDVFISLQECKNHLQGVEDYSFKEDLINMLEKKKLYIHGCNLYQNLEREWNLEIYGETPEQYSFEKKSASDVINVLEEKGLLTNYPPDMQREIEQDLVNKVQRRITNDENPYLYSISRASSNVTPDEKIIINLLDDRDCPCGRITYMNLDKLCQSSVGSSFRYECPLVPRYQRSLLDTYINTYFEAQGFQRPLTAKREAEEKMNHKRKKQHQCR